MNDVTVFVDPLAPQLERDALFDVQANRLAGDAINAPWVHVRERLRDLGIAVHTADRVDDRAARSELNLFVSLGRHERWPALAEQPDVVLSAYFTNECPIVEPALFTRLGAAATAFRRVYSFTDDESLRPFVGCPLTTLQRYCWPQSFDAVHEQLWRRRDRRFLVMINTNKMPRLFVHELYTERLRALEHFATRDEIDLYGRGWDGASYRVGRSWAPATVRRVTRHLATMKARFLHDGWYDAARRAFRGVAESKSATLAQYDYAICFENMMLRGWITEKLFDCFFCGTIPVYLGAPDIEQYVPRACFVDMRDFADYAELGEHLRSLPDHRRAEYREAARSFIDSDAFFPFSKEAFAQRIVEFVAEDVGARTTPM
jgi:alpha(1,3/1,4) fucosyltransferase